ncbi:MAG: response regulator, partial [Candidatus Omnitrophica bacterium]|nr:response regulator [Candidatus Omnitrophota bacterium]
DNTKECCEWAKKDIEIDRIHTAVRLISSEIRRRRTEKTLYESERKFKELFEESPIGIAILNSEGRLTEANRACFGLPFMPDSSEPIEKSNFLEDICVPSELLLKELYAGGPIKFETSFDFKVKVLADGACVRKEGKRTFIDCRITPLSLAAGGKGAGGYLVQMEDITERKELEIRLRNAYVELEGKTARLLQAERLSAVGENTAALVHEINNPASNIINLIDGILTRLYKGGVVEKEEIIRTLESTEQEIERIADITARFLGFARPTGPEKTACSVGDILRDVVEMRKAVMDVMGIRVKWELSEELLVIIAGSGRLKQAFLNIVMNAVSFMKDTPVRDLTLRAERAKDAEGRNIVRVSFEDTGPGIMEKDLGRIWEPFYTKRADGMRSGQGLAVVKDVAEEHGGRATVESQLGQGTTFVMEFPTAGQETDVIKFFAAEARKNIYGSLWHDINNAMGVIGYLEMMILDASNLPDALLSKLESINMDAGKVVDLTRHAQAMTEPDEFLNIVELHIMRLLASAETFLRKTEGFAGEKWRQNFELVYDKGFRLAKEKIDDGKCLLSIADSFSRKPGPVKIEKVLEDVLSVFKRSKRFFPQDLIAFDKIDRLFHSRKDIFILGDEAAFKFALFNILIMGMKGTGLPVMELEPEEKRLEVTVDSNRRSGEIIISFQNNYWLFADSQLEETDLGYGEQGAAVLKWERESSNCLALAHRILTRFAGRIILDNGKDGAVIRMFMPYQSRAEDASVQDRFSAGTEEEEVFRSEPETIMEGRPNIIVADDEPLQRDIFKSMLEEEYNVWLARNGQEAFDLIEEAKKVGQEFDLAVFDVSMPPAKGSDIIDGLVLTRRVRQQGHGFPVLISTGHAVGDPRFMRLENEGLISGVMMKTLHMAEKMLKIGKALKTAIPRNAKAVELQMVSADKTALIYGPGFDKGSKKLRSLGFKGTIVHARDAHELKERLMSGEHFDIIINTTSEDLKELIKKLLSGLDNSTPIIDGLDDTHHLQDTLLHICA